jgi:hypothetical protein
VIGAGLFAASLQDYSNKTPETDKKRDIAAEDTGERSLSTSFAALIDAINAHGRANVAEESREDDERALRERITIVLLLITMIAIIFQVIEMRKVYEPIRAQAESATEQLKKIDRQLNLLEKGASQTDEQISVNKDLAAAARDQAKAARDSILVAREDTVESSRAWIGPTTAVIDTPSIGSDISVAVTYINSGRQPGTGVVSSMSAYIVPNDEIAMLVLSVNEKVKKCFDTAPQPGGQVAYPTSGFSSYNMLSHIDKSKVDDSFIRGGKTMLLTGCIAYETFKDKHHSSFCFFYTKGITKEAALSFCNFGNVGD